MSEATAVIVAAFIAAAAALWIGWLQYRASREQSRIALFEKRWETYLSTKQAVQAVGQARRPTVDHLFEINRQLERLRLLFPDDVVSAIELVRECTKTMGGSYGEIWDSGGNLRAVSQSKIDDFHEAQRKLMRIWGDLFEIFLPHMRLRDDPLASLWKRVSGWIVQ